MLPSHINYGCDGSQVAHHLMMGKDHHVGHRCICYAVASSTYAGKENLHWALPNHVPVETVHYLMPHMDAMKGNLH
jgi:hypothetical protein